MPKKKSEALMSNYCYEAVDAGGLKIEGTLEVADQVEALRRIKQMGLFPIKIAQARQRKQNAAPRATERSLRETFTIEIPFLSRVRPKTLAIFTRQLATLIEAGMPIMRGLHTLEEQEENAVLRRIQRQLAESIEGGSSLSEALSAFPRTFPPLYVSMVKAGEMGGALEITLRRLAEFMEKAQKIKGKIKAAMFYPCAVMAVAVAILGLLAVYVIPRFQEVFEGLLKGAQMPGFTLFILKISDLIRHHVLAIGVGSAVVIAAFLAGIRTHWGRWAVDRLKLRAPVFGPLFRKLAISRFSRTLGTLLNSGVPILQALTIVKETAGNVVVARVISSVHDSVKEGETIAVPLKASGVFPSMVAGMVDIGEQTGSLPDMLMKIADNYDDDVDNAVAAMTSLLEPVMIVFLAVVVGSIVVALFLPIIQVTHLMDSTGNSGGDN